MKCKEIVATVHRLFCFVFYGVADDSTVKVSCNQRKNKAAEIIRCFLTMAYKFDSVCRLCMGEDAVFQPIFSDANNLCTRIEQISPKLQVSAGDGLPAQVCQECLQQVNRCYDFRLQCEQSDLIFRHYLSSHTNRQDIISKTDAEQAANCESESLELKEKMVTIELEDLNQDLSMGNDTESIEESTSSVNGEEDSEELKEEQEGITRYENGVKTDHKCESCSEIFISKQSLEQHQCATQFVCKICMKVLKTETGLSRHLAMHKVEPSLTCSLCGKTFSHKKTYLSHMRVHSGLGYKCKDCNKIFPTPYTLKIHSRKHTGEKPYVCEICGKSFSLNQGYKNHKMIHTGLKPFQCPTCSKSFAFKIQLQSHILIHTGEKPYVCEICGHNFRDQSGLAHHMKAKHTEKKSIYKCSFCPKSYMYSENLKAHIRTHTGERPHECDTCGRSFTIKSLLTNHLRVHTGEKKYNCTFCKKKFSTSSSRDRHVRTHTGETPYECVSCHKAFSLRRDLKNHIERFHPEALLSTVH